jgi:hypothetical protein
LEQAQQIASQATTIMAQAIIASMVEPKGHKGKGRKKRGSTQMWVTFPLVPIVVFCKWGL